MRKLFRRSAKKKEEEKIDDPDEKEKPTMLGKLEKFWYDDLPPLDGRVRFLFWAGLYYWDVFDYVERSKSLGSTTHWHYDLGVGMPGAVGWSRGIPDKLASSPFLGYVARLTRWSWALSAVGLGGPVPRAIAAVGITWLCGSLRRNFAYNGRKHAKVLSMWASLALATAPNDPAWSIDGWLRGSFGFSGSRCERQAARKFVLLVASCSLFFAGWHKLAVSGLQWCDGATLLTSIKAGGPSIWRGPVSSPRFGTSKRMNGDLQKFVVENAQWTGPFLGFSAILGELGAPLFAVFGSGALRNLAVLSFAIFHVLVATLMYPVFYMNIISYLVCLDWSKPPFFSHPIHKQLDALLRKHLLLLGASLKKTNDETKPSKKDFNNVEEKKEELPSPGILLDATRDTMSSFSSDGDDDGSNEEEKDDDSAPQKKRASRYPVFWTAAAFVVVGTCLLQVEVWPFSSFALFAFHPSQAPGGRLGLGYVSPIPYNRIEANRDAKKCASTPWINPPCANLRHGWHFDTWTRVAPHWTKIIVTGYDGRRHYIEDTWPSVGAENPRVLRTSFQPLASMPRTFREGLRYVATDAIGLTIAQNYAPCFFDDPAVRGHEPHKKSPASGLAKRIYHLLTKYQKRRREKLINITHVALYFAVSDDLEGDRDHQWCLVGNHSTSSSSDDKLPTIWKTPTHNKKVPTTTTTKRPLKKKSSS